MPESQPLLYKVQFREGASGPFADANAWESWDRCIAVICDVFKENYCREVRMVDAEGKVVAATNQNQDS